MARVTASPQTVVRFVSPADRFGRRWRSLGSGGANWLGSSAVAWSGIPVSRRHVGRSPTRASGRNQQRQIAHGLFRASGMVILHRHHASARTIRGSDQNVWISFGKLGWVNSRECRSVMRFEKFSFDSIRVDGTTYEHDVVIDRGEVRRRKKKPFKKFREAFGHTPISPKEAIPWKCRRLVIGTGTGGLAGDG